MPITTTMDDGVALLRLELGRGNAINTAFIDALERALEPLDRPEVRALVLTGHGRVFCAGLDLPSLYDLDRVALGAFVDAFCDMFCRVLTFPKPVVAAVNGHAVAGGCILAMCADYRIVAPGAHTVGINEVPLGLAFPAAPLEIARHVLPREAWTDAFLGGRRYTPAECLAVGLAHALGSERGVVADALDKARALGAGAPDPIRDTKADLLEPVLARIAAARDATRARFLDRWFAPEARARVGAICEDLARKR